MHLDIAVHNTDQNEGNSMNNNRGSSHKEKKMKIITKTTTPVAVLVALSLALSIWAAEPPKPKSPPDGALPPYGSADFQASRQRPVGWRGNIQGTFLGATPPLAWNTGSTEIMAGQKTLPPGANVLWKVPMPNWASCGCIVVGKKVITRASPSTLLCYDADTGKRLWFNKTDIFDYHFKDDPKKAQEMRTLCQKWERQCFLGYGEQGKHRLRPWTVEEKNEWLQITKELLGTHPEWFGRMAKDTQWKALFERALGGWWPTEQSEIFAICGSAMSGMPQRANQTPDLFVSLGFTANKYQNCEDPTISTPVSDGTCVYTASGHNLICCYELETGKLRWMTWTGKPRVNPDHGNEFWPSPWIFDGKLFIYNNFYLRALDPDTGKELWSFDFGALTLPGDKKPCAGTPGKSGLGSTGEHIHAENPAYLTVGKVPVVVTSSGHVVRAADGKVLAEGLGNMFASGYTAIPWDDVDDVVYFQHGFKQGANNLANSETRAIKLAIDDQGTCSTTVLWTSKGALGIGPVYYDGRVYGREGILDAKTGKDMSRHGAGRAQYQSWVLTAGPRLWGLQGTISTHPAPETWKTTTDLKEPSEYGNAEIKKFGNSSLAYTDGKPFFVENPEAPVRTWARQALAEGVIGWLNAPPNDVSWMNNCYGAPPFCVGDRVYVRSRAFLYCLGPKP